MADLAKTRTPIGARTRGTRNRAYTLPNRRETRAPGLEVNAPLVGPNASKAQRLSEILGVAKNAGNSLINYMGEKDAEQRDADRAQGLYDATTGAEMDEGGSKSYANAYYSFRGKEAAIEAINTANERATALMNDPDADPTIEDFEAIINEEYEAVGLDENGQPRFMGNPVALRAMGGTLAEARIKMMGAFLPQLARKEHLKTARGLARSWVYDKMNFAPEVPETPEGEPAVATLADQFDATIDGKADTPQAIETTGRLPVGDASQITDNYQDHLARGSQGIDIDGQMDDPITAPASGTVKKVATDGTSGRYIVVSHGKDADGNEIISTYSHLNGFEVSEGDPVAAGQRIARMGNSGRVSSSGGGDGSHLHYRVKVGGKDVNPLTFSFNGTADPEAAARAAGVDEVDIQWAAAQGDGTLPALDVEEFMATLPEGFDKGLAKTQLIEVLMTTAERDGRPNLLEAAANSIRDDGTPSFNPKEERLLRDTANALRRSIRSERNAAETELQNENLDKLRLAVLKGQEVPMADIIEQAEQGALPPAAGLWYENYRETEEARREAKADKAEREATAEEQARITSRWNVRAARIAAGVDTSLTVEDVTEAFESGELGVDELGLPSTEAFTLFSRLRSAISAGQQERLEAPEVQAGLEVFDAHVQTQQGEGGIVGLATGGGSAGAITVSRPVYVRAIEDIKANIKDGMSVSEAVQKGIDWAKKYGEVPGTIPGVTSGLSSSEASRLEELESRSLGE